nr:MAG TPA: Repressor protein CI [Caudoviricetes sp.]
MATFQNRLNEALALRNMTAAELSRISGVNEGAISQYKRGKYKASQPNIEKIAKYLNVSIPWLMGVSDVFGSYENGLTPFPNLDNILPIKKRRFPLLGDIAAGPPIEADGHIESYVLADEDIEADYALRIKGDSMIGAGIEDGDIVFIREQPEVENGEIAAVYVDGSATLKKVYKTDESVELWPVNPKYRPLVFTADNCQDFKILGKAVKRLTDIK